MYVKNESTVVTFGALKYPQGWRGRISVVDKRGHDPRKLWSETLPIIRTCKLDAENDAERAAREALRGKYVSA